MNEKICNACKQTKPLSCFGNNRKRLDCKQPYCRDCAKSRDKKCYQKHTSRRSKVRQARKESRLRNKMLLLGFLKTHPCVDCGESDPLFLDFDHVRGQKKLAVTTAANRGWSLESLTAEMDKCDVRCVKCHRVKTAKEQGWYDFYYGQIAPQRPEYHPEEQRQLHWQPPRHGQTCETKLQQA